MYAKTWEPPGFRAKELHGVRVYGYNEGAMAPIARSAFTLTPDIPLTPGKVEFPEYGEYVELIYVLAEFRLYFAGRWRTVQRYVRQDVTGFVESFIEYMHYRIQRRAEGLHSLKFKVPGYTVPSHTYSNGRWLVIGTGEHKVVIATGARDALEKSRIPAWREPVAIYLGK